MSSSTTQPPRGVQLLGRVNPAFAQILTPDALAFVAKLQRAFGGRRAECLQRRQDRQTALHRGETLDFLPETKSIREGDWACAPDRKSTRLNSSHVEISYAVFCLKKKK